MSTKQSTEFATAVSALIGVLLLIAVVYILTAGRFASPGAPGTPEEIAARTKPIGNVTLAGAGGAAPAAPSAAPAAPAAPAGGGGPGAEIYNKACFACHATGAAGAPKLGDKAAWEPRVAQGIDQLLKTAIAGKGAMPPRGTCATCSDDELRVAIEYMLAQAGFETAAPAGGAAATPAGGTPEMSGMSGMSGDVAAPVSGGAAEETRATPAVQ